MVLLANLAAEKGSADPGLVSSNLILPDVTKMVVYDPRQAPGRTPTSETIVVVIFQHWKFLKASFSLAVIESATVQGQVNNIGSAAGLQASIGQPILGLHPSGAPGVLQQLKSAVPIGIVGHSYFWKWFSITMCNE